MQVELSKTQQQVLDDIYQWFNSGGQPPLTLGGFAGTGKTTLMGYLSNLLREERPKLKVAFIAYTGKASVVLEQKLREVRALYNQDQVSTIHRLIYAPVETDDGDIIGWEKKGNDKVKYDLIVVDEASMLNKQIWQDLQSYKIPTLAVGDHGQLPPVEGSFNLMQDPQLKLEEIYRQEKDNPIIVLSELARKQGEIPFGPYSSKVKKIRRADPDTQELLSEKLANFKENMLVLTGYNHTRVKLNKGIRQLLEFGSEEPQSGDRVICLRNNHQQKIFNGMTGTLLSLDKVEENQEQYYKADILLDGEEKAFSGKLSVEQFGQKTTLQDEKRKGIDLFDFGYALTVHKAQGSQARTVIVFEERFSKMTDEDWRRWLYTAVTRAEEELILVA